MNYVKLGSLHILQQHVSIRELRDSQEVDDLELTNDYASNIRARGLGLGSLNKSL